MTLVPPRAAAATVTRRPSRAPAGLAAGLVLAVVLLLGMCLVSLVVGSSHIPFGVIWHALWHDDPGNFDVVSVRTGRVPRTALGLLVGAALGLAGTVMQGISRNALADPGLLGVNAGAAVAVVVGISLLGMTSLSSYVWLAFVGAALAAVAVYGVSAAGPRGVTPTSLVLAGAALTALLTGLTSMMLLRNVNAFDEYRRWTVGSFSGRGADVVLPVLPFIAVGAVLALSLGRVLNVMSLGPEIARSLGQRTGRAQVVAGIVVVVLCGGATAAAGPIVFVGLAVPHIARQITGPDYRWILPYSMLIAPILMLGADVLGRVIAYPGELQVGVVTALVGAPVFIALVRYRSAAQL